MVRPVLIQYPGQTDTYEVSSAAKAKSVHPGARIVRYADSFEPYEDAPKPEKVDPPPAQNPEPAKA